MDYDYTQYSQYNQYNQANSTQGHHKTHHHKKQTESTDPTQQWLQPADNSNQNVSDTNKTKGPLDNLIKSGTITSEQESAIKSAFESSRMAHSAASNNSTAPGTFKDPLDSLVESGTITKEQESAIKNAFKSDMKTHKMPSPPPQVTDSSSSSNTTDKFSFASLDLSNSNTAHSVIKAYQAQMSSYDDSFWNTSSGIEV
ncbi:MAG TPA: hypothetical protein VK426_06595 [Methanobacterium sp.]|nr:hypothetical protein [Methanobacterium sp.]